MDKPLIRENVMRVIKAQEQSDLEKSYNNTYSFWMQPGNVSEFPKENDAKKEAQLALSFSLISELEKILYRLGKNLDVIDSEEPSSLNQIDKEQNPQDFIQEVGFAHEKMVIDVEAALNLLNEAKRILSYKNPNGSAYPLNLKERHELRPR